LKYSQMSWMEGVLFINGVLECFYKVNHWSARRKTDFIKLWLDFSLLQL